eukprot:87124-Chlamydomonas_euryale.AAC.1
MPCAPPHSPARMFANRVASVAMEMSPQRAGGGRSWGVGRVRCTPQAASPPLPGTVKTATEVQSPANVCTAAPHGAHAHAN